MALTTWEWTIIGCGAVMICLGLIVANRALFRDRSRGRPRCPKCWYSMEGTPASEGGSHRCPECGRVILRKRQLHHTRRWWRLAFIGLVLLIVGAFTSTTPLWKQGKWVMYIPSAVLVRLAPAPPDLGGSPRNRLCAELWRRVQTTSASQLSDEHLQYYLGRWLDASSGLPQSVIVTRISWPQDEPVWVAVDPYAKVLQELIWVSDRGLTASVRLHRTREGSPGAWMTFDDPIRTPPLLQRLGIPDPGDARIEVRLESGERVVWEGVVASPFELLPPSGVGFEGVDDPELNATISEWLRSHLGFQGSTGDSRDPWRLVLYNTQRPSVLDGIAFGAYVEIFSLEGELLMRGEIALMGGYSKGYYEGPLLDWVGTLPAWGKRMSAPFRVVFHGNRSLALRDFDRWNTTAGRNDPEQYWSGEIILEPTWHESDRP